MPSNKVTLIKDDMFEKKVKVECDGEYTEITKSKMNQISVSATDDSSGWTTQGTADLGDLELKDSSQKGGSISGIAFPGPNEVVIFTNSPGCFWYYTGRKWIWRCKT